MKKLLLSFVVLPGALAIAQVGINTEEPQAMLDISAKEDQKGDLRIEDVDRLYGIEWILTWDENEQKVKRISISDLKWDEIEDKIKEDKKEEDKKEDKKEDIAEYIVDKGKIDYIRKKQPDRADEIFNKIKQCTPQNIVFDKHFGDGKHDFVYCATTVTGTNYNTNYNKTWLNLNLGAEYADINSPDFNPTVSKTGEDAHNEAKTYGSLYQWQRASDGHEFRNSKTTTRQAQSWTDTGSSAGKFIIDDYGNWVYYTGRPQSELTLWQAGGRNNPCPSGYHVPTFDEWREFHQAVAGHDYYNFQGTDAADSRIILNQDILPNFATAGTRDSDDGRVYNATHMGRYWSSSAMEDYIEEYYKRAHAINFNTQRVTYIYKNARTEGHSVRCIKD